jgi:hypothetical protein
MFNPSKGLANGSTVYMYSSTFSDEDKLTVDYEYFLHEIEEATPGQHIHINKIIPTYINVEVPTSPDRRPFWRERNTIIVNKFIIPIGFRSRSDKMKAYIAINNTFHKNVTTTKHNEHRVKLSFVITFHKLQGKTIPKLIIVWCVV